MMPLCFEGGGRSLGKVKSGCMTRHERERVCRNSRTGKNVAFPIGPSADFFEVPPHVHRWRYEIRSLSLNFLAPLNSVVLKASSVSGLRNIRRCEQFML